MNIIKFMLNGILHAEPVIEEYLEMQKLLGIYTSARKGVHNMKVGVSSNGENLDAPLDPRFGRCHFFLVVNPDDMSFEAFNNESAVQGGGAGIQAAQFLAAQGVEAVITGNCGPNAVQTLAANGIELFDGQAGTVREVVERFKKGNLKPTRNVPMKVTYHDPCNLGRKGEPWIHWDGEIKHNLMSPDEHVPPKEFRRGTYGVYEPPREVIRAIPGLELVEMERIKEYSWCCGSGGGVIDINPEFAMFTATERLTEAESTGADALVTACPWCKRNFTNAINQNGGKLKVYDVVELLEEAI